MEQPGSEFHTLAEDGLLLRGQDNRCKSPIADIPLCGYVKGLLGAHHYGLRGLPFSPYHPYDLLRLFLFNRFIAFSCFSLLLSPLLK